jgi:NADH dehydrogenase/NADH:ubiquinone oxidoreductase subunit G
MTDDLEDRLADRLHLTIDGHDIEAAPGSTILEAARQAGLDVPILCYSDHTKANGLCRLCVVETEGGRGLQAACVTVPRDGARIHTRSEAVDRARRTILEMLAVSVDVSESPDLQRMLQEYGARPERFEGAADRKPALIDDNPMYIRDYAKCVLCWRCVQVCADDAQYTFALTFSGRGFHTSIATFFDRPMPRTTCVFCGQCVGTCPTGALKAKREYLLEQGVPPAQVFAETRLKGRGQKSVGGPRLAEGD